MPTAEASFSAFLNTHKSYILKLALAEGFVFHAKESLRSVTVRCTLPDGTIRFIIFDDHRTENSHGTKPHVCNQWHKTVGDPISYTMGEDIADASKNNCALVAAAIMCFTQSEAYNAIKSEIFS